MKNTMIVIATALVLAALALVAWASLALQAQLAMFQAQLAVYGDPPGVKNPGPELFATAEQPPLAGNAVVYVATQPTDEEARTWRFLRKRIPMRFDHETPLREVLQTIRETSRDPGDDGDALRFYLDPNGLEEVDASPDSWIIFEQDEAEVAAALKLMLDSLGLVFTVDRDGLIIITSPESAYLTSNNADALILSAIEHLRDEVAALRWEVASLRTGTPVPKIQGPGFMSGGLLSVPPAPPASSLPKIHP